MLYSISLQNSGENNKIPFCKYLDDINGKLFTVYDNDNVHILVTGGSGRENGRPG